jgi:WhiB family redox-sensing transcriptional regulator
MSAPPGVAQARHIAIFIRGDLSWRDHAACAGMDPREFFPRKSDAQKEIIKVCLGCPVRMDCLQYALDTRSDHGVWGGTTQDERRQLLRRRIA